MKKNNLNIKTSPQGNSLVIFKGTDKSPKLEVRLEKESVWLTQKQMADLFNRDVRTINDHVEAVFREGELKKGPAIRKYRITATDGKSYDTNLYNLDVIISVGYRVKSLRGTQFRIWATKILREHIVQGYTLNQKRLAEHQQRLLDLQKAVSFLQAKATRPAIADQSAMLLSVIQDYAASLSLFYQYDKGLLKLQKNKKARVVLNYEIACGVVTETRLALAKKGEASDLFGQEYGEKIQSILGTLYQTFDGTELYGTVEEKA